MLDADGKNWSTIWVNGGQYEVFIEPDGREWVRAMPGETPQFIRITLAGRLELVHRETSWRERRLRRAERRDKRRLQAAIKAAYEAGAGATAGDE